MALCAAIHNQKHCLVHVTIAVFSFFVAAISSAHVEPGTFTSCYLFYSDVSDLSFTYNYNDARILAHSQLISVTSGYNIDLLSNVYSNFEETPDAAAALESLILDDGCNLIVSTSSKILADFDLQAFAQAHPSVMFAQRTDGQVFSSTIPNYANIIIQETQHLFMSGAVASSQAQTCVGFVYPHLMLSWQPNAFFRGFLWANRSEMPLYVVHLDGDSSETAEARAISLLVKKGCDVIVSMTTNNIVNTQIAALNNESVMSVGYGSDASLIAGDSVLTSMFLSLTSLFYNITADAIDVYQGHRTAFSVPTFYANKSSEVSLADVSPRAASGMTQRAAQARSFADSTDCSCGTFADELGIVRSGCLAEADKRNYPHLDNRIRHLSNWTPPSTCPPGTVVSYHVADFSLTCVECPAGYFAAYFGSSSCAACDGGLVSEAGSAACHVPHTSSFDTVLVVPIVLGGLVAIAVCVVALLLLLRTSVEPSRDPRNAPRGPTVAIAMIGVDGMQSDRNWRSSLTNMCDVYDRLASIVAPAANKRKVYTFVSVGDVVMIAGKDAGELLSLLTEVHDAAYATRWPCKIRLKLILHCGEPIIGESKRLSGDDDVRITYSGTAVDLVRGLWRKDTGCELTVTAAALQHVELDATRCQVSAPLECAIEEKQIYHASVVCVNFIDTADQQQPEAVELSLNPLDTASLNDGADVGGDGESRRGMSSASETSEGVEDDLARLVTPSAISKEELEALRSLGVDLLQKFLRVFTFDDQVSIVVSIAKKLHVQTPKIPEMKTAVKKSFNVLRNSLKHICNQLLMSIDEKELQQWLDAVTSHVQKREANETATVKEDTQAVRPLTSPQ